MSLKRTFADLENDYQKAEHQMEAQKSTGVDLGRLLQNIKQETQNDVDNDLLPPTPPDLNRKNPVREQQEEEREERDHEGQYKIGDNQELSSEQVQHMLRTEEMEAAAVNAWDLANALEKMVKTRRENLAKVYPDEVAAWDALWSLLRVLSLNFQGSLPSAEVQKETLQHLRKACKHYLPMEEKYGTAGSSKTLFNMMERMAEVASSENCLPLLCNYWEVFCGLRKTKVKLGYIGPMLTSSFDLVESFFCHVFDTVLQTDALQGVTFSWETVLNLCVSLTHRLNQERLNIKEEKPVAKEEEPKTVKEKTDKTTETVVVETVTVDGNNNEDDVDGGDDSDSSKSSEMDFPKKVAVPTAAAKKINPPTVKKRLGVEYHTSIAGQNSAIVSSALETMDGHQAKRARVEDSNNAAVLNAPTAPRNSHPHSKTWINPSLSYQNNVPSRQPISSSNNAATADGNGGPSSRSGESITSNHPASNAGLQSSRYSNPNSANGGYNNSHQNRNTPMSNIQNVQQNPHQSSNQSNHDRRGGAGKLGGLSESSWASSSSTPPVPIQAPRPSRPQYQETNRLKVVGIFPAATEVDMRNFFEGYALTELTRPLRQSEAYPTVIWYIDFSNVDEAVRAYREKDRSTWKNNQIRCFYAAS